jgi:magnesium chelatase subunit I
MGSNTKPSTLGELKVTGYRVRRLRDEMRHNLLDKIRSGQEIFPGIVGYSQTVIPQLENAIIAGQDVIFLGERGQAKSRIMRQLTNLLDAEVPMIQGCEINDNPFAPIRRCRNILTEKGDTTEITC